MLVQRALAALDSAAALSRTAALNRAAALSSTAAPPADGRLVVIEERNIWQPDSWLIDCCWQTLAAAGAAIPVLQLGLPWSTLA